MPVGQRDRTASLVREATNRSPNRDLWMDMYDWNALLNDCNGYAHLLAALINLAATVIRTRQGRAICSSNATSTVPDHQSETRSGPGPVGG
ncbi:hypothetical protein [Nocardia sp. NPDC049526]|uniref:hypothetical protein n=1 Tax=Nocardia sp. NPDC049526 TaxID=3364316 RepID=UPI0037B54A3C